MEEERIQQEQVDAENKRLERLRLKEIEDSVAIEDDDDGLELDKEDDDDDNDSTNKSTKVGSLSMDLDDLSFVPEDNTLVAALTLYL